MDGLGEDRERDDHLEEEFEDVEALDDGENEPPVRRRRPLRDQLLQEVSEAREAVTRSVFQTVSICSIAAGTLLHYLPGQPYMGLAAGLMLPLVLVTSRLTTANFATVQRLLGYLLHLELTRDVPSDRRGRWKPEYRRIGWEEAMRAWRVFQPTLLDRLQKPERVLRPWGYKRGFDPHRDLVKGGPHWYAQRSMLGARTPALWRPGSYLKVQQYLLSSVAWAAVLLMLVAPMGYIVRDEVKAQVAATSSAATTDNPPRFLADMPPPPAAELSRVLAEPAPALRAVGAWMVRLIPWLFNQPRLVWSQFKIGLTMVVALGAAWITRGRLRVDRQRRKSLEDGLLSIHSCALLWQAVVIAHYEARENARMFGRRSGFLAQLVADSNREVRAAAARGDAAQVLGAWRLSQPPPDGSGMSGYTFWLGQEASSLACHADDIHGWIGRREA